MVMTKTASVNVRIQEKYKETSRTDFRNNWYTRQ